MAAKPSADDDEAQPCTDLTAFQIDALAEIARLGRPHGLAIKDELENRYGTVHHGRLYPNLDTLVVKGLVEKGELDKRTNYYTLTDKGARELRGYQSWLAGCMSSDENEGKELVTDGGVELPEQNQFELGIATVHFILFTVAALNYVGWVIGVLNFETAIMSIAILVAGLAAGEGVRR